MHPDDQQQILIFAGFSVLARKYNICAWEKTQKYFVLQWRQQIRRAPWQAEVVHHIRVGEEVQKIIVKLIEYTDFANVEADISQFIVVESARTTQLEQRIKIGIVQKDKTSEGTGEN